MEKFLCQITDDYGANKLVVMSPEKAKAIEWFIEAFDLEFEINILKIGDIEQL